MIKLSSLLREEDQKFQQLPTGIKKHFLEIISTFGHYREAMQRKSDIRTIAETLGGIADACQEYTLREGDDWFDRVTIKRYMSELKKFQAQFQKEAAEAKSQEQRLEALYEDMGNVISRYFEIADVSEEMMKERLGIREEWDNDTPIKKTGEYAGKSVSQLQAQRDDLKKKSQAAQDKGEHTPEDIKTKQHQVNFAIRAKDNWPSGKS